jgi:hypothetical protein
MENLKQFHLYAKVGERYLPHTNIMLSKFESQYWIDHNWSFGMHGNYFYTLPFHFDHLNKFYKGFDDVKSNNSDILMNNPRIWYNVKSIELCVSSKYDRNFIKQLKMKMPKLNLIKFIDFSATSKVKTHDASTSNTEMGEIAVRLDNVTTIKFTDESIEDQKDWIIHSLPNLSHLILYNQKFPLVERELAQILNKKIRRLDTDAHSQLELSTDTYYIYISNVECINLRLVDDFQNLKLYANNTMTILKNFQNLKTLRIYSWPLNPLSKALLTDFIASLDMNEIRKTYEVKHFVEYSFFSKKNHCQHTLK